MSLNAHIAFCCHRDYVLHYTASVISVCKYLCSIVGDVFATNPAGRLDLVLTASFLGDSVRRRLQFPRAKGTYL